MANFRAERLYLRVAGSLDFDPNEGIDAAEFASIMVTDSGAYDRHSLQDFTFAPFDNPRWFSAADGLKVIRLVIEELKNELVIADESKKSRIEKRIEVLHAVEDRLDLIDLKDFRFHLLARDLG
ncbi:hypothetical protein DTL21_28980 [Bremerella cremea]|uniref:Uncharacterized protein n=1 Tax=Blastopirellula marina TaxID=124 RepID=A0A2S8F902_9BACT|nr:MULTISPECIES: hypothetical protein [Pirellulaceae]PQO28625.1 hypothetical protein C5Y83_28925 [Blastopirellula marina]RCS41997.1 hypothetical protein DTL21_28980 [Bremerella cremea]